MNNWQLTIVESLRDELKQKNALESHEAVRFKSVFIVTPERTELFPKIPEPENTEQKLPHRGSWQGVALTDEGSGATWNIAKTMGESVETSPHCHSDRSASGVEESTTWQNEPTQDKTCHLGRFLDSLRSRNDIIDGWFHFVHTGYNCHAPERHIGRSPHTLTGGYIWTTSVAPIIVNCPLSIVNSKNNCQLSTVNCQLVSSSSGARLSLSILPKKECRKLVKNTWQTVGAVVTYASCLMNGHQMARRTAKHWKIAWKKLKNGLTSY